MPKPTPLQVFTFGYYGWGNATPQLVRAVDAVEVSRGFKPPIFVDIRIRRAVRAAGFSGPAFENLLGPGRHRWMKELGNKRIVTGKGPFIQIAKPSAASDLLDLAIAAAEDGRRVIFFCGCAWPRDAGRIACHRTTVASLLLQAARRRESKLEVVEWPGGAPRQITVNLDQEPFSSLKAGGRTIPAGRSLDLATAASMPWGSVAALRSDGNILHRVIGPAVWKRSRWQFPVIWPFHNEEASLEQSLSKAASLRRSTGWEPRFST